MVCANAPSSRPLPRPPPLATHSPSAARFDDHTTRGNPGRGRGCAGFPHANARPARASYPHHRYEAPARADIAKGPTSLRRWDPQCRWISSESDLRQTQRVIHLMILVTRPEPTVRPPSRIAKPRPGSMAMGWISSTEISVVSPGMTMSVPSGRVMTPVTSVVRK